MSTVADLHRLHAEMLRQPCWSAGETPGLGGRNGFSLPALQAPLCFDTTHPDDLEALRRRGVAVAPGTGRNHIVLEHDQDGLHLQVAFHGQRSRLVLGRVASLVGSFLFLGDDAGVAIGPSPGESLHISAELIGHGSGVLFGPGCTCYGARCTVENGNSIRVGDGCLFSDRIDLRASDSHALVSLDTGTVINLPGCITVGPSVWIGTGALLLKNATVGAGSVVSAHAVVTRAVPPRSLAVGSPARIARENVTWFRDYPGSLAGYRFAMTEAGLVPYPAPSAPPPTKDPAVPGPQPFQPRDVLAALYRTLLLREPDEAGLQSLEGGLAAGNSLETVIASFLHSEEFARVVPRFQTTYKGAAPTRLLNDVSQYGEIDRLVRRWVNEAATHRLVVDVGARGRDRSNSYDLMRSCGWRGLLIEANPALIPSITAEFDGLDLTLVSCAVSDYEGASTFHLGVNDDVSSLTEQAARDWGPTAGQQMVDVRRLPSILREHAVPEDFDLLSLDIEGEDLRVLNDTVAAGYRPRWVIIEASYDFKTRSLDDVDLTDLVRAAYRLVDQTEANLILRLAEPDAAPPSGS